MMPRAAVSNRRPPPWWPWLFAATWGLVCAVRGPVLTPDSTSYLENAPFRPPLYPLFLDVFQLLSAQHALRLAVLAQAGLGALVIVLFARRLHGQFAAGAGATIVAFLVLAVGHANFACYITSECLTYAAYLALLGDAIAAVLAGGARRLLVRALVWAALAVLLRGQMLFVVPVAAVGVAAVLWMGRARPGNLRLLLVVALLVVATGVVQRGNNYVRHGRFDGTHFTGIQLLTVAAYLADPQDLVALGDTADPDYAARVWRHMQEKRLFASLRPPGVPSRAYFASVYVELCLDAVVGEFLPGGQDAVRSIDDWAAIDRATMGLARVLLLRHSARYLVHVVDLVYGYYKYTLLWVLALATIAALGLRRDASLVVLVGVCGLWLANTILVCMVESPMTRYFFYTDASLIAVVVTLLASADFTRQRAREPAA